MLVHSNRGQSNMATKTIRVFFRPRPFSTEKSGDDTESVFEFGHDGQTLLLQEPAADDGLRHATTSPKAAAAPPSCQTDISHKSPSGTDIYIALKPKSPSVSSFRLDCSSVALTATAQSKSQSKRFEFDHVFSMTATQANVFRRVRPVVESVLDGYNATIIAYGATGSGKTYSISGPNFDNNSAIIASSPDDTGDDGVLQRSVRTLFRNINARAQEFEHSVQLSFVELYNNDVRYVSSPCSGTKNTTTHASGVIKLINLLLTCFYLFMLVCSEICSLGPTNRNPP